MNAERGGDRPGALSAKGGADGLEPADEVQDFTPAVGAPGGGAKVGAAGKGPIGIDEAAAGAGIEHGTGAVRRLHETGAAGRAEGFYGEESFAVGEPGSVAGVPELAALGAADAIALDRAGGELGVNLAHGGNGEAGAFVALGVGGGHLGGGAGFPQTV